jgi:putative colanic acid biosynthesis acetyltransferase WcaF
MNLSDYKEKKPKYFRRILWYIINNTIFRLFTGQINMQFRNVILRLFGAKVDKQACVYNSSKIFAPWNLVIGRACIGPNTELYCKDKIVIGDDVVISQGAKIYTASHDISNLMLPLKTKSVILNNNVWIAADAFVGMGVTIGEGAVVGARACVFKNVEPWIVVGGNPAKFIKKREIKD